MVFRNLLTSLAVSLLFASTSLANAPLPKNLKRIEPSVRFEGIDKHADHVFFVRYISGIPGYPRPAKLVEIKESSEFKIDGTHIFSIILLAIKRKDFDKRAKEDPKLEWLTEKAAGVSAVEVDQPSTTAPVKAKVVAVTSYRITLKDGNLNAEKIEEKQKSQTGPNDGLLPIWVLGFVCSVSVSWLGVWGARYAQRG